MRDYVAKQLEISIPCGEIGSGLWVRMFMESLIFQFLVVRLGVIKQFNIF